MYKKKKNQKNIAVIDLKPDTWDDTRIKFRNTKFRGKREAFESNLSSEEKIRAFNIRKSGPQNKPK